MSLQLSNKINDASDVDMWILAGSLYQSSGAATWKAQVLLYYVI